MEPEHIRHDQDLQQGVVRQRHVHRRGQRRCECRCGRGGLEVDRRTRLDHGLRKHELAVFRGLWRGLCHGWLGRRWQLGQGLDVGGWRFVGRAQHAAGRPDEWRCRQRRVTRGGVQCGAPHVFVGFRGDLDHQELGDLQRSGWGRVREWTLRGLWCWRHDPDLTGRLHVDGSDFGHSARPLGNRARQLDVRRGGAGRNDCDVAGRSDLDRAHVGGDLRPEWRHVWRRVVGDRGLRWSRALLRRWRYLDESILGHDASYRVGLLRCGSLCHGGRSGQNLHLESRRG